MIGQNALLHAEKCRFCWMCRHLCPVQHQTGKEINTPRAKGLLLSMVNKNAQKFDKDMAQAMYECLLCDACTNDCATGYQPPLFIREARTEAVVSEIAPDSVMKLIENIENTGNIFGEKMTSFGQSGSDVLVYIGEVAAIKEQEMAKSFLKVLEKAGISARVLENEPASGAMLGDLIGYTEEVRNQASICAEALNRINLPVVVLDSYDAEIMIQKYPAWGCTVNAGVTTATSFVANLLENKKLSSKQSNGICAAVHDDDRLARTFHEFDPVRSIAGAAGFEITEMFSHGLLAKSCGTAVAYGYMPEMVRKIAGSRWEDLKRTEASAMLTANPEVLLCLGMCVPENYKLIDLYSALL